MNALTPFAHSDKLKPPYVANWLPRPVRVFPVTCKVPFGVSSHGATVHRVASVAGMLSGDRLVFGARWNCGEGSTDVTLLANADAHGGEICRRCDAGPGIYVYRCYSADRRLLYIGCTANYGGRMTAHASATPWWPQVADITRESFSSRPAALAAERLAIATEKPVHNRQWAVPA